MEKDINIIIKNVVNMMQEELTDEQLHKLENVLYISFHGVKLQEECTSLVTSQSHWDKILKLFIASKRLENCSQGTIDRYVDCVTKLVDYLHKRSRTLPPMTLDIISQCTKRQEKCPYPTWIPSDDTSHHSLVGSLTKDL